MCEHEHNREELLYLVNGLLEEGRQDVGVPLPTLDAAELRGALHALITVRPPSALPSALNDRLHSFLQSETIERGVFSCPPPDDALQCPGEERVWMWRGDIRLLAADAIVNAANSALLGCFQPSHRCIDNVILGSAGPVVRLECAARRDSIQQPEGHVMVTGAGALAAKHIFHTVGPSISQGHKPNARERSTLASCYRECLQTAAAMGLESIAFPSISTGIFGYPADEAADVAVNVVLSWLEENRNSKLKVVFDVFTDENERSVACKLNLTEQLYVGKLRSPAKKAAILLQRADYVIVTGGAGLSAAAGIDYNDEDLFANFFPDMVQHSPLRCMYDIMSPYGGQLKPERLWGYLARQVGEVRFGSAMIMQNTYDMVKQLVGDRSYFCVTSNVDGLLHRLGHFDANRVWEKQGSYANMQCRSNPRHPVWPSQPILKDMRAHLKEDGTTAAKLPACPTCNSSNVFLQVRGGGWFTEQPQQVQQNAFRKFVSTVGADQRVVILELGSGFNTPSVIRFPNETMAARANWSLVRVSLDHAEVPSSIRNSSVSVRADINAFLRETLQHMQN